MDVMEKYGFNPRFSQEALAQADHLSAKEHIVIKKGLKDLRGLLWSSIDNVDSEDLDQIECVQRRKNGEIHVKVAISDVDSLVSIHSPIDSHASYNGTSVYQELLRSICSLINCAREVHLSFLNRIGMPSS
jgi:exoribonuclease-2